MPTDSTPPINIWVVEDDPDFRRELSDMLGTVQGLECNQRFQSTEAALKAFAQGDLPDVVLVDIHLPGANGISLIKDVKASYPEVHMIVLTISENRNTVFQAICSGASGYLLKNDSLEDIVQGIHAVCDGGSPLSGSIASLVLDTFKGSTLTDSDTELKKREIDILDMLSSGMFKKEIAGKLNIAVVTVDYYLRGIYTKLQVNSQAGAVGKAIRKGLI